MAIKEFIVKNKKRNICIMLALVLFITSVFVIKYVNRTNAGVFVKDDNGNISLKNNINILEIVAQNGQQVLGYTIEGQEPIKKSQIESYKGTMDLDVDDFRQATGYKVTKTQNGDGTFSYKVDGNVLNNTFNDNVLGKQMGVGEIKVNVVQASNVRVGDIDKADLIYINSNDYNDNLLYYYDQFVNKGSYGIEPGNLGISFNGRYSEDSDKFGASINKIKNAAGFPDKANLITKDDFGIIYENYKNATDGIDLNNYKEYNFDAYVEKLKTLPETTFSGDDRNIISRLNTELGTVNEEQKSYAEAFLKDKNNLTDENLEKTINYFFALGDDQLLEFNIEGDNGYISDLKDIFSVPSIHQVITERNIENSNIAATTLSDYKVKIDEEKAKEQETQNPEEETEAPKKSNYGLTPDDYKIIYDSIEKLNVGKTYGFLSDEYIKGYTDENNPDNNISGFVDIVYTGAIDNANITTLIENINNKMREEYMKEIANLPGSGEDTIDEFSGNLADILEFVGINSYNKYYRDKYVSELKKLEAKAFLKEDGTPDEEKINTFFDSINADSISEITSYKGDMSFKPAMELYDRAINGKVALMYNSDLLSDGGIGKYNEDLQALAAEQYRNLDLDEYQVDNTNNVYKVLLLLRQIQPEYYNQTLKDKIDDLGAYWPEGIGNGGSYLSWNKETFGTDYTNYAKYHEPDVVGQTYDVNGIAGGNTSYVYKRIYTYSGNQFFGGKIFAEGKDEVHYVINPGIYRDAFSSNILTDKNLLQDDNYVLINLKTLKSGYNKYNYDGPRNYPNYFRKNNINLYAYTWKDANRNSLITGEPEFYDDNLAYYYRVRIPKGYNNILVKPNGGGDWTDKSNDFELGNNYAGRMYDLISYSQDYLWYTKYGSYLEDSNNDKKSNFSSYALGGITNSINNGSVDFAGEMDAKIWMNGSDLSKINANIKLTITDASGKQTQVYAPNNGGLLYNNQGQKQFAFNDEMKIGDENSLTIGDDTIDYVDASGNKIKYIAGSTLTITFQYEMKDFGTVTRNYSYKKAVDSYTITVNNFDNGKVLEYCGYADITFNYDKLNRVMYNFNNEGFKDVKSGDTINVGQNISDGATANLVVRYYTTQNDYKEIVCGYKQSKPVLENNYLSKFTFNNDKGIPYDNTLTSDQNSEIVNATKGGIIRYILNVTLTNAIYPINVLEIEPAAAVNKYASFDGAKQLAKMLNVDAEADGMNNKNYKNYINVKYMSVKEFNTRNEDLESMYDLIYFGIDSGYQVVNYYNTKEGQIHRTRYQDSSMNGLVYTGIGDQYRVLQNLKGDAPSDYVLVNGKMSNNDDGYGKASGFPSTPLKNYQYWMTYFSTGLTTNADPAWNLKDLSSTGVNKFYVLDNNHNGTSRLSGNDITVKRMNSLLNYVKAGYPIMMADELINSDNYIDFNNNANDAARWRYLDRYSKLYNFILQAKALGRDASGNYTDSSVFYDNKTYASIINEKYAKEGTNPDYLSSAEKFDGGLSFAYRRVAKVGFTFESGPQEYHNNRNGNKVAYNSVGTIIKPTEADYKNFNVVLDINNIGGVDQTQLDGKYTYQMIIDKSGVGKFEEGSTATIDCNYEYVTNDAGKVEKIKLSNKWPRNMSGFIPWKIEVTSKENPGMKFSYIGYSAFEDKSTPVRDVYVLWIYPESGNNLRFDKEINKYKTQINQGGYNIHLISVTYKIFNQTWAGETSYIDDVNKQYDANTSLLKVGTFYNRRVADHSTNLDGDVVKKAIEKNQSIDMIVVGFSDSHTEMDISNIAAQKNIQYFLDSGHSLLYSHDNSSYWYSMNWYRNVSGNVVSGSNWYWGRNSTSFFRRMLGMDQYGISYGGSKLGTATSEIQKQNIATEEQIYANAKSYLRPDLVKPENLRGITETTVFKSNTGDKLYSNDLYGTNTNNRIDWSRTNKVSKINKGQITEYPFILDDTINVSTTHAQYSTISMEDPDLTVWYYLDDDSRNNTKGTYSEYGNNAQQYKFTKGDGANNYYIYSKGNITYTGAGHASGATESEMKLFINTVIASLKSGNYDPVVNIQNSYEAKDSKTGNTYKYVDFFTDKNAVQVIYNPSDYDLKDGELAFTDAKVFVDIDGDEGYTEGKDILLNDPNNSYLTDESGAVKNVIGSQLINRQDTDFYLTLDNINKINTVISQRGGSGDIYNYNIVIEVSDKGYLKSKNPIPGKGYDLFRLNKKEPIKYDYFNLN